MRNGKRMIGVIAGCFTLVSASLASAQNWPQWRGPEGGAKVTGFNAPPTWPKELAQKWKVEVGAGDATPALVGDRLYVFGFEGADDIIQCVDAGTGKQIWQNKYPPKMTVSGAASRHGQGPRSSPAVGEGKVVTLGVGGILSCLDASSGTVLWRKDFASEFPKPYPQFFTAMSPIIADGVAIAHIGGQGKGALMAFELATGNVKWKWEGDAPGYDSPVLMTVDGVKQIVEQTEKLIVGVGLADGKLLWQMPFAGARMSYNAATPIVEGQTVYITGGGRGTKALKIEKKGDAFEAKELWTNAQVATQFNTPVLKDGHLYGLSDKGNVFCLSAADGKTLWTDSAKRGNFGSIVDAGPALFLLTPDGVLTAFKPSDKEFSELAHYKVTEGQVYAYPVIAGNRIFIRDQNALTLFMLQ